jgi:Ca2+-transporting ATPase
VLERAPRPPETPLLGRAEWANIAWTGVLQAAVVLGVFVWSFRAEGIEVARNLAFSTIVFVELFRAFGARSPDKTFFEVGAFSNLRLLAVVGTSAVAQVAMHHVPAVGDLLHLTPLSMFDCLLTIGLGLVPVTLMELLKLARRGWTRVSSGARNGKAAA